MRKVIIALFTIFATSVSAQELTEVSTLTVNTTYGLSMDAEDSIVYFGTQMGYEGGPWNLQAFNYSDPSSPTLMGEIGAAAAHLHVEGGYVYRSYTHFTKIMDFSDPSNPTSRGGIDPHPLYHYARAITGKGPLVFVAIASNDFDPQYSIIIINVSNPDAPYIEATIARNNFVRSMMVVDTVLYVAGIHLRTYNISDPANPVLLGTYTSDWIAGESLWTDGTYAYFSHSDPEFGSPALDVVNVSDPANMVMVGRLDNYWGKENDGDTSSNYLISAKGDWLNVLDISDPTDPHVVFSVDPVYPDEDGVFYTGYITNINYVPSGPEGGMVYAQSWKHIKAFIFTTTGPDCDYAIGDVNGSDNYNGLDITYGVAFLKGGPDPLCEECALCPGWWYCGDVNASCSYNGLDITYGVSYFKGGSGPIPCADCPPAAPFSIQESTKRRGF